MKNPFRADDDAEAVPSTETADGTRFEPPALERLSSAVKPFEEHATEAGTAPWLLAATKAAKKWGEGKEMSRADFDAATSEVAGFKVGVSFPYPMPPDKK